MKSIIIALTITSLLGVALYSSKRPTEFLSHAKKELRDTFNEWKTKYGKEYPSQEEEEFRFKVFASNLEFINKENSKQTNSFTLGMNVFGDMTQEELQSMLGTKPPKRNEKQLILSRDGPQAPEKWDWREHPGVITPVQDQGASGHAEAIQIVDVCNALDEIYMFGYGPFIAQQLYDCVPYTTFMVENYLRYVQKEGITDKYPRNVGPINECKIQGGPFKIKNFTMIPKGDVNLLKENIVTEPTLAMADAAKWAFYTGGIFSQCGKSINHAVQVIGYTNEYWIVKNSWGTYWGEKGYIRLAMGDTCGIADYAWSITV